MVVLAWCCIVDSSLCLSVFLFGNIFLVFFWYVKCTRVRRYNKRQPVESLGYSAEKNEGKRKKIIRETLRKSLYRLKPQKQQKNELCSTHEDSIKKENAKNASNKYKSFSFFCTISETERSSYLYIHIEIIRRRISGHRQICKNDQTKQVLLLEFSAILFFFRMAHRAQSTNYTHGMCTYAPTNVWRKVNRSRGRNGD